MPDIWGSLYSLRSTFLCLLPWLSLTTTLWWQVVSYPHNWWKNKAQRSYVDTHTTTVTRSKGPQIMLDARTRAKAKVSLQLLLFKKIFISSTLKLLHNTNIHDWESQRLSAWNQSVKLSWESKNSDSSKFNLICKNIRATVFLGLDIWYVLWATPNKSAQNGHFCVSGPGRLQWVWWELCQAVKLKRF